MDLHICDLAQTFTLNALSDATLRDLHVQTTCVRLHHGAALLFSQNMVIFFFFFFLIGVYSMMSVCLLGLQKVEWYR